MLLRLLRHLLDSIDNQKTGTSLQYVYEVYGGMLDYLGSIVYILVRIITLVTFLPECTSELLVLSEIFDRYSRLGCI